MTERLSRKSISFQRPFSLASLDGVQPAGSYDVLTVEEQIDSLSFIAFRRLSTMITMASLAPGHSSQEMLEVDPGELAEALARDAVGEKPVATCVNPLS